MSDKERVDRLDEAIIDEILGLSDAEAAALVGESDVARSRQGLLRAKAMVGKLRLARAKADVALHVAGRHGTQRPQDRWSPGAIVAEVGPRLGQKDDHCRQKRERKCGGGCRQFG